MATINLGRVRGEPFKDNIPVYEQQTNCKNCGAPLHFDENGKSKCEYCGTEYL